MSDLYLKLEQSMRAELAQVQRLIQDVNTEQLVAAAELFQRTPGNIIMIGNGGSNAITSHMAEDYTNNFKPSLACTDTAMMSCFANDFGWENAYRVWLEKFARPGDSLVLISSSGGSKNILNCAQWAQEQKMPTVTLSGFKADNPLRQWGDVAFYVASHSYKDVEVMHLLILHTILESLMKELT